MKKKPLQRNDHVTKSCSCGILSTLLYGEAIYFAPRKNIDLE